MARKTIAETPVSEMHPRDAAVAAAMGDRYEELRKLALLAKENPNSRRTAEVKMAAILDKMTTPERVWLRKALAVAGAK